MTSKHRLHVYTPREIAAISMADRVIVRLFNHDIKEWFEAEVLPTQHETTADCLRRVQSDISEGILHDRRLERACLYVACDHPLWGRMLAAMPRSGVPLQLEHQQATAADFAYPLPQESKR